MSATVLEQARALLSELDEQGQAMLETFCSVCRQELQERLRPEVDQEAVAERLDIAAALMAAALYLDARGGPESRLTGFRVGEVSVDCGDGAELRGAALMRRQAELIMARYVADGGGLLLGVSS